MPSSPRLLIIGLGVSVAYVLTAQLGFRFAVVAEQITTVWAPTGIGLAALLLWGPRLWPAVWVGAFASNAFSEAPLWTAAAVASGNTLEAVAATWVLHNAGPFDNRLQRLRDVVAFVVIAAGLSTMVAATIGVATLCAAGVQPWARFAELWGNWWLGDAVGALVVGPAILTTAARWRTLRAHWLGTLLLVGSAVLATHVVFGQLLGPTIGRHPLEYVIFPFVIAAAVRYGQPTTAFVVVAASAVTILNTVRGEGPFASAGIRDSLVFLQGFMGVLAGTGLVLAVAIAERETGERRRAVAYRVGEALAASRSLESAAPTILRAIGENLEWQVTALWLVEPRQRHLTCAALWTEKGTPAREFVAVTRTAVFKAGIGLPGRVWASDAPIWISNIVEDTNFQRGAVARESGLHSGFGFPIRLGAEVVGTIECFHRTFVPPDADLLRTMSSLGNQIGQFIGRKREEAAVSDARRDAEAANRAKDEFLATLSHELRTPLNAIVGWTRMLLDGTMDPPSTRRALEVIDRNAHAQAQLVGDILDVSRIITGGLLLDLRPMDLGGVIGAALDAVRPAADAKKVQLRSRLAARGTVIQGDPPRLQQVIWNLMANAVKFTPAGGTVTIELADSADGVLLRVRDDGSGIDPEFLPFVFDRFRQADGSVSRQHGGLGLGLAIVRHLVELHGGTVRAESAGQDQGATFTVELPKLDVAITEKPFHDGDRAADAVDSASPRALAGYRLLIVDDEDDARVLIATLLEAAGAEVRAASSVPEALETLDIDPPDAILADIGMPGADGYVLIREVRRRDARRGQHLPAAAITAYAGDHDRDRALAAGFDRHVAKPISRSAIVNAVLAICADRNQAG